MLLLLMILAIIEFSIQAVERDLLAVALARYLVCAVIRVQTTLFLPRHHG